ncbi:sensor histidine kinase [Phreatobacter oligotrophus]|uniref:sensor histidine kinase n=1 Tax=Phreatobacter oligotrophus TaxID=1122261 RepID=UPI002352D55D|nr:sensor histidine kinase [Phreatobacter oligotrophus]MBX9992497.1 sensor histidine kinase [Phreatobacter oligotrophus]
MIRSLETRLVAMVGAGMLAALAVFAVAIGELAGRAARDLAEARLSAAADQLAEAIEITADGTVGLTRSLEESRFLRPQSGWGWLVLRGDRVIGQSRSLAGRDLGTLAQATGGADLPSPFGGTALVVARTIDATTATRALVIAPGEETSADVAAIRLGVLGIAAVLALVLLAGIVLQVRWGLKPLRRMTADIDAVRRGSIAAVPPPGLTALDPVADAVNRLTLALRHAAERSREDAANLAHAIKTPLALIMLRAGPGGTAEDTAITSAGEQIRRQVDRRLRRSRATAGIARPATPLRAVLEDAVLAASHRRAAGEVTAVIAIDPGFGAPADREDLEEVLGALVDNAFRWAGKRVELAAAVVDGHCVITIDDDGPGIPPDHRDEVLARGRRLDETASGQGLGLAIAADIVSDIGGSLVLATSPLGGLRADVRLPAG